MNSSPDNEQKPCLQFSHKRDSCDLNLWPSEHKINSGLVFTKSKQDITYENSVIYSYKDNKRKPFLRSFTSDSCDLDL